MKRAWWAIAVVTAVLVVLGARQALRALEPREDLDEAAKVPTDEEMRQLRRAHHAELSALRELIGAEPGLTIIGADRVAACWLGRDGKWGCPDASGLDERGMLDQVGLTSERYARYLELLTAVGGRRVARLDGGRVQVTIYAAGIVTSGVTKDLVWSQAPPSPLVADTDRDRPVRYTINYAALEEGWYIEHSSN